MTRMKDGRELARANSLRCLRALHRFGWLRTKDLAALCWQRWASKPSEPLNMAPSKPSGSAVRMAQRTVRRLHDARLVISSRGPDGSILYTLAEGGVRVLRDAGIQATNGKSIVHGYSSAYYRHRCIANEIAISAMVQGFRASTEREIAQGLWFGGEAGIAGKRPDVLLRNGSQVTWCEVERSRKNAKDYQAFLTWLTKVLNDHARPNGSILLGPGMAWSRVIIVGTPAFEAKLRKDMVEKGWTRQQVDTLITFELELYHFEDILFP